MRREPSSAPGTDAAPPMASSFQSTPVGRVADHPCHADAEADRDVRADGAVGSLADGPQQRGHPQAAEDQADDAAEQRRSPRP